MKDKKSWLNPEGYWKVTTEGDCEGRSTNVLGIFYGHFVDIALALAENCMYRLEFEKIPDEKVFLPKKKTREEVAISFRDQYGVPRDSILADVQNVAKEKNINVEWKGQLVLNCGETEEMKKEKVRKKLEGILTPEEMKYIKI